MATNKHNPKHDPFAHAFALPTLADLNRREFLTLAGKGISLTALAGVLPACGGGGGGGGGGNTLPDPGIPASSLELHVLNRTSFGVAPEILASVQTSGVDAYIDQQLDYTNIDTGPLEAVAAARYPLSMQTFGQLSGGFPANFQAIVEDLVGATLLRAYLSPRQLYEVMVEFWTNHFSIHLINGILPLLKPTDDYAVIRPHALGNFSALLHASAKSPAMLYYLDNFLNFTGEPQENYARELLELHTVGDGNFTEDDVKEVARCFTGWSFDRDTGEFRFFPSLHDNDAKTVLGNFIPAGGGLSDGETVLDLLAAHPATAQRIASKLCQRFVADTPPSSLVTEVADRFTATDGDLVAVLRTLFAAADFRDARDQKLTRPMEFVGQLVRGLNSDPAYPSEETVSLWFAVLSLLNQLPFYWVPPNGYPDVSGYWGSTSGFLNRWRIALALNAPEIQAIWPVAWLSGDATTIEETIDSICAKLLQRKLADADRQLVIDWIVDETGLQPDETLAEDFVTALTPFITSLLASTAYYQLR